ncbi:hypothetical protein [Paraburkholderia heleia]|uniref:hypothetical protein n=1 Tax=Paraburkholderia heleia TaxID=634127 RepID=UPI002AB69FC1|nr:hypothetical protein [Paraburkholderia heleia]
MNYKQLQALAKADAANMTREQRDAALIAAKNACAGAAWPVTITVLNEKGESVQRVIHGYEWAAYYFEFSNGIV